MLRFQPRNHRRLRTLRRLAAALALTAVTPLAASAAQGEAGASFETTIEGAPEDLRDKLDLISELVKANRNYATTAALRRAARRDVDAFNNALAAAG